MKIDEYKARKKEIIVETEKKLKVLNREYALDNNPVKIGDIVEDHSDKIIVEKIKTGIGLGVGSPCCVYFGPRLTTKGVPFKNGSRGQVWQFNILR